MKKIITILMSLVLVFSLIGCSKNTTNKDKKDTKAESTAENKKEEKVLRVQFVPTNNDGSMEAKAKPFAEYLSKKMGRKVEVTLATNFSTIVEAMGSGKVDIGIMPPAAYVQAKNQGYAKALLTSQLSVLDEKTGKPVPGKMKSSFKGEILVKANSDIKTIQDLKGKKVATLSPTSASGFIYPVVELNRAGINPMKDMTLTTINDIPSEITSVINGQQDACFVFEGSRIVFNKVFKDHNLLDELRVLYLTEADIPNDAIAVQPKMDEKTQELVKKVFLEMPNDKEGKEAMSMWGHISYSEVNDDNYIKTDEYTKEASKL